MGVLEMVPSNVGGEGGGGAGSGSSAGLSGTGLMADPREVRGKATAKAEGRGRRGEFAGKVLRTGEAGSAVQLRKGPGRCAEGRLGTVAGREVRGTADAGALAERHWPR